MYSSTAYAPYGEPYAQAGTTDLSFTGQDQDTVSGVHDFLARKYPPVQGRWLSPDPAGLAAANPANPQSWNRYAYVMNNPLSLVDPLGLSSCTSGIISGGGSIRCVSDPSKSGNENYTTQPDLAGMFGMEMNHGCDQFCRMRGGDWSTLWFNDNWSPWAYEYKGKVFDTIDDLFAFEVDENLLQNETKNTAQCIATGLRSTFAGSTVTTGASRGEVGGHWNFDVQMQFSSQATASTFSSTYAAASQGWPPPARFGSGPALHLENLGGWSVSGGTYAIAGTAHIDLFNPNRSSLGGGGLPGIAGHVAIDYLWGHIVQAFGGNIDPKSCPF